MASPPTPYPTTSLSTTNALTGERQLRRTPVGLRRMYDAETATTATQESEVRGGAFPFWLCCCLLLLLLLLALLAVLAGLFLGGVINLQPVVNNGGNTTTTTATTTTTRIGTGTTKTTRTTTTTRSTGRTSTTTATTTTTTPPLHCRPGKLEIDLLLILDTSTHGLSGNDFILLKQFLTTGLFADFVIPRPTGSALIPYGYSPVPMYDFDVIDSTQKVINLINFTNQDTLCRTKYPCQSNLGKALTSALTYHSDRQGVPKVALVFMGESSDDDAVGPAETLRNTHYTIITVALGTNPIATQGIASSAADEIRATDMTRLVDIHNRVLNRLCSV